MLVDTRVFGYVFDGWVACPDCCDSEPYTRDRGAVFFDGSHTHGEECTGVWCERERGRALFAYDHDGLGLTCDDCGDIIFELDPEVEHVEYGHDAPEDEAERCILCRDYLESHDAHMDELEVGAYWDLWCEDCADTVKSLDTEHLAGGHFPDGSVLPCRLCQVVRASEADILPLWEPLDWSLVERAHRGGVR